MTNVLEMTSFKNELSQKRTTHAQKRYYSLLSNYELLNEVTYIVSLINSDTMNGEDLDNSKLLINELKKRGHNNSNNVFTKGIEVLATNLEENINNYMALML